jgi:4-amino-4-deoxy-L-arabinose transferase-like glycosyltransferase
VRPALLAILALAAVLYAWGLSGYANEYYSAAVRSGTQNWKAFFFGSLDSASYITVDKPPMALWVQEIFARIFGFGTWSLLLPSVLMGVAAVLVLYATVRRAFGPVAGLIAALVMTLTPITVAINKDNNPDTLLVLLLVLAAWAAQRALSSGRLSWLLASALFLGCGFNTKMLQAYLLLPALFFVVLFFGQGGWLRRFAHLLCAGVVLAVSSFWWMVVVDLIPASSRPYIGGSTDNTVWDLVIGYNGLGRVTGSGGGGPGRGGQGARFAGASGPGRLFNAIVGGQISWLLPFAALALVAGVVLLWRRPRTDLARAAVVLWGGWLVVHFVVFSFSSGTMHPYYTTALAPAVGALTGIGAVVLFGAYRRSRAWAWVLPLGLAVTGALSFALLRRSPGWHPWVAWTVAVLTVIAAAGLLAVRLGAVRGGGGSGSGAVASGDDSERALADRPGPTESSTWDSGSTPTGRSGQADGAAPAGASAREDGSPWADGSAPARGAAPAHGLLWAQGSPWADESARVEESGAGSPLDPSGRSGAAGSPPASPVLRRVTVLLAAVGLLAGLAGPAAYAASAATGRTNGTNPLAGPSSGGFGMGGPGGMPGRGQMPAAVREMMREGRFPGGRPAFGNTPPNGSTQPGGTGTGTGGFGGAQRGGPGGGGPGGRDQVSSQLISYLEKNRDGATWLLAVPSAQSASSIILQTGQAVIAMGGFTGSDPAMTVAKLQAYVNAGKLHYVMTGGGGPGGEGSSSVTSWVSKNCTAVKPATYGVSTSTQSNQTVYRCG